MKVYITGNNSFIAKHYISFFKNKNYEVFLYTRESKIEEILDINPDIIIHCAAEIYDDSKMFESNVILTQKLLTISKNINYKRFVYIGSSSEYGFKNYNFKEDMVLDPINLYAATKACGTLLCKAHSETYKKPIFCFRPFSVYGPQEKEHKFFPVIFNSLKNNRKLEISPKSNHDWIYIDDFIDSTTHIIENYPDIMFDIINIGTGIQYSNLEVVKTFEKALNVSINYNLSENHTKLHDTNNIWCADIEKLKYKYKYFPKYDLLNGIKQYANFK